MIAVTGATGQLGALVVELLLQTMPADQITAAVRTPAKAAALAKQGVQVREADYSRPDTLAEAFQGATRVLLISGNEVGKRVAQHNAVIDAAKAAGARLLAYTSILHADTSTMMLASEHLATERYLQASGIPFTLLRNGWYTENLLAGVAPGLQHGALIGASGEGRFAAATRAEYAAAAVAVLRGEGHENQIYELAGDTAFTHAEFAEEVSRQTGKGLVYRDMREAEFEKALTDFVPPELARVLADSDAKCAKGELDDASHTLSRLIGHRTRPLAEVIADALKAA